MPTEVLMLTYTEKYKKILVPLLDQVDFECAQIIQNSSEND